MTGNMVYGNTVMLFKHFVYVFALLSFLLVLNFPVHICYCSSRKMIFKVKKSCHDFNILCAYLQKGALFSQP